MNMKKLLIAALTATMIVVPVHADLPDVYTSVIPDELYTIDVDSLTEDELRTAYNRLRDVYQVYFQSYVELKASLDEKTEPVPTFTPTPTPVKSSVWSIGDYVDQFDMDTGEHFVGTKNDIKGKFSNSATTDSLLNVAILIDNDGFGFRLFEYGDNPVKGYYSDGHFYDIWTLVNGDKTWMNGKLYDGGSTIHLAERFVEQFIGYLKSGSEVKMYLSDSTSNATYSFTIPASTGFAEMYDQVLGG